MTTSAPPASSTSAAGSAPRRTEARSGALCHSESERSMDAERSVILMESCAGGQGQGVTV